MADGRVKYNSLYHIQDSRHMKKYLSTSLIVLANLTFWFILFDYFSDAVLVLDEPGIKLPKSYISDSLLHGMSINAMIFYLNYSYLIGKYMAHQLKRYLLVNTSILLFATLCESVMDVILLGSSEFPSIFDLGWVLFSFNLKVHIAFLILAIISKIIIDWFKREKLQKQIESHQIETELALLKSQVHPHFLFNTLNTLYSSAYEFGDVDTANGIGKLSHLLRYMLYETKEKKVLLENEIEYIENYIVLQKMRFANEVNVTFNIKGETTGYTIAPMMLITLVENAFKHGISPAVKTDIDITLNKQSDKFIFQVKNDRLRERAKSELEGSSGGLGIVNLKKRLEMIYTQSYTFNTYEENNKFIARLELI